MRDPFLLRLFWNCTDKFGTYSRSLAFTQQHET